MPAYYIEIDGEYGPTFTGEVTDEVVSILDIIPEENGLVSALGKLAIGLLICCEDADVRFSFETEPAIVTKIGPVLYAGASLFVRNFNSMRKLQFITTEEGKTATLNIIPQYR